MRPSRDNNKTKSTRRSGIEKLLLARLSNTVFDNIVRETIIVEIQKKNR